ncbi:hypothetical protein B0G80_5591 [Paraburkholderia sp. BL6669N2]|uniref:hypothetical protein n=1 Tax=Paraburkholderia sp. BL6669N2 TaxID=1938807 RepID=UPI000E266CAD|nr:hypothetical protein [Paraburkholderia sp. BL6669N2]REG49242.1 hypothetical protein B0G80_5591 [Paraburkholderia sp. BL6669N2]
MSVFNWLFRREPPPGEATARETREALDRILNLAPQLRLVTNHAARLAPAIRCALEYVRALTEDVPIAREASAAAWSSDPHIHAFFAVSEDVTRALSRSAELRAYFDRNALDREAFILLGMAMTERRTLGVAQHGDAVRTDVERTTVSFGDHQVRVCERNESELRDEIVLRVVEQLALEALDRIAADVSRRGLLEQERALLNTRLMLLGRQGKGMNSLLDGNRLSGVGEMAALQAQLEENNRKLAGLGLKTDALEREISMVCEMLTSPGPYIQVEKRTLRLDRTNVIVDDDHQRESTEIQVHLARVPGALQESRAFCLVRFARSDLHAVPRMSDDANQWLL